MRIEPLSAAARPGAGIAWRKDKPHFDEVVGASLLTPHPRRGAGRG
jgi:hypothetical protein